MIFAADCNPLAPIFEACDSGFVVPHINEGGYIEVLEQICAEFNIDLLVPCNDQELHLLAEARSAFQDIMTHVLVSRPEVIGITNDKVRTYEFLFANEIQTPLTIEDKKTVLTAIETNLVSFPIIIKPRFGSGSDDVYVAESISEFEIFWERIEQPIAQRQLIGQEFGVDIFNGADGVPRSVVPRKKLEVRAGETDKAISIADQQLIDLGMKVGTVLGHYGPADVDCFKTDSGIFVLEINPRFGGGYPLTHLAGGNFIKSTLKLVEGQNLADRVGEFEAGVVMSKTYSIKTPSIEENIHWFI
jgi:carbamoyl-phosphate synthase large subunit